MWQARIQAWVGEIWWVIYIVLWFSAFTRTQFQYNPEWFQDEEDGDASDDWDLAKYRREQEEDNLAAEELRIANLALQNGNYEETTEGSAGGGD